MTSEVHESFKALARNDVAEQKRLCRELYKSEYYIPCFLFSSKLIDMGEESEKIIYIASLAKMGYTDLAFHIFESEREKIERYLLICNEEDLNIASDLLFLVEEFEKVPKEISRRIDKVSGNLQSCFIWNEIRKLKENLGTFKLCLSGKNDIVKIVEDTDDAFVKTRAGYCLYNLGIVECRKHLTEKYLRHEEKVKLGLDASDDIYYFENLEDISKKVWYFNYQDEHMHFFTYPEYNIHFLRFENEILVIDCGSQPREFCIVDIEGFLAQKGYSTNMIKAVLISHAHYDHYSFVQYLPHQIPVYATKETIDLIFIMNRECLRGKKINFIQYAEEFEIGKFKVSAFPNGHILGSAGFDIYFGNRRLIYTGDFSLHSQMILEGMSLQEILKKGKVTYLVCEHTYGIKDFAIKYEDAARCLAHAVDFLVKLKLKVFIPAFSIGRAQEVLAIINAYCRTRPKVIVDGLAKEISLYYLEKREKNFFYNVSLGNSNNVENNIKKAEVVVASSGMLQPNSIAVKYVQLLNGSAFGFIKSGYIEEQQYIHEMIKVIKNFEVHYFDIPLSAHSNYFEILRTLRILEPEKIILVHGQGLKGL